MALIHPSLLTVGIKGAGEMASGVAVRLKNAGFGKIFFMEIDQPLAVRRKVSFCEAVYDGVVTVEGVEAAYSEDQAQMAAAWERGQLSLRIDPSWQSISEVQPDVLIDATIAKRNLGTELTEAPLVIGLGPGFTAPVDVHRVIETMRGHDLGRVIHKGTPLENTGIPGSIDGYTIERVLRAPAAGRFHSLRKIGDQVVAGDVLGSVNSIEIKAGIEGVVRGLLRDNTWVGEKVKIGDIDPRGKVEYCFTVSEKARTLGGAVLEAILGASPLLVSEGK